MPPLSPQSAADLRRTDGTIRLQHYAKADELLAEIEANPGLSNPTETSLAIRAVAHAVLTAAAARTLKISRSTAYAALASTR